MQMITGFQIEFLREPFQSRPPNNPSISSNEQEAESMLSKGAVKKFHLSESQEGFYSTLFLLPKKDGGTRPVINLKRLNKFIPPSTSRWRASYRERPAKREQLASQDRSEGCIFHGSNPRVRQKIPPFFGVGKLLPRP